MKISLTPEQARDLPYPLGCQVWYNFPTLSAQSFDASDTEPPLLKRGIIDSVTLDMFTRNMVYKVVYKDDTNNISIIDEVGEKELAYGASCPVSILDSDAAVEEEEDAEEEKKEEEGATPKNSQEGTVLYAEPSQTEPGKVVYTIMIHGEEEGTQSRYETGIKAERVKYRKVVNENVIDESINKEVGIVGDNKVEEADRISPLTLQTEEEEVPVSSITLKSSPEEGQIDDSNNTKRSSVSTLGDGGSSTIHRQSMGGSTRGSGGNDTDVGSYMRGCYGSKGHDFTRDTSRDSRPIDEASVDRLLADRLHCKRKHMFDKADELKDELLNVHGVTVLDNRRDGTSKTYTTESVGIGRPESRHSMEMEGGRGRHGSFDSGVNSLTGREYGTKGHDYVRDTSGDSRPIDEAAVDKLLSDRLYYKKKHMFDKADELRAELLNVFGVTVWDSDRIYTTERGGGRVDDMLEICVPLWLQGDRNSKQELFYFLVGTSRIRQNPRLNVNDIGQETNCRIIVHNNLEHLPMKITIVARKKERVTGITPGNTELSRLMIIDLLLEYVGNDGSRGRLVYDIGISSPGPQHPAHSSCKAIQAGDPFGNDERVRYITVLPLPYNSAPLLRTSTNFRWHLQQETDSSFLLVGDYFNVPCKLCNPYLMVMSTSVEGIDRAVRMIDAELATV